MGPHPVLTNVTLCSPIQQNTSDFVSKKCKQLQGSKAMASNEKMQQPSGPMAPQKDWKRKELAPSIGRFGKFIIKIVWRAAGCYTWKTLFFAATVVVACSAIVVGACDKQTSLFYRPFVSGGRLCGFVQESAGSAWILFGWWPRKLFPQQIQDSAGSTPQQHIQSQGNKN